MIKEQVEVCYVDEEGILLRSYALKSVFFYEGDPEDSDSPLMQALQRYYRKSAPATLMSLGYETPRGVLTWQSEMASPFGEEDFVEIGERLFLVDEYNNRFLDEFAYEDLAKGQIPVGWELIPR
ncbi:MAG: hypothetical protein ACE15F_10965 [bacterium]